MNPLDEHIQTETIERKMEDEIDYDNMSFNSMSSLGSIPGYETTNNFYEIQRAYAYDYQESRQTPLDIPYTQTQLDLDADVTGTGMDTSGTGTANIRERHRFDSPYSNIEFESEEEEVYELVREEPSLPPPPLEPTRLTRAIDIRKWLHGLELFYKLHSRYNAYHKLKYLFVFLVYMYNIALIKYFTWNDFVVFWSVIPLISYCGIEYIQTRVLFNNTPRVSRSCLSYYPGAMYDYGCLIHIHHGNFHSNTYEYWIVYDTDTKKTEQIIVNNYNYYNPNNGPHF